MTEYIFLLQVYGLCGNNDGNTQGELGLPNPVIKAGSPAEFAAAWVVSGGKCRASDISPGPRDTCNIESQVSNGEMTNHSK